MDITHLIYYYIVLVMSASLHEYAHALAAKRLGDTTAEDMGRLTINPIAHIDPFGTVLLPAIFMLPLLFGGSGLPFFFAYAKPVPYDPAKLRNRKWGPAVVGVAGPLSNILLAVVFALLLRLVQFGEGMALFLAMVVVVNIGLAVFNMLPIPPLDGSKLLYALFPHNYQLQETLDRYGMFLLLMFVFFGGHVVGGIVWKVAGLLLPG